MVIFLLARGDLLIPQIRNILMTDSVAIPVRDKSRHDGVSAVILCSVPQITLRCIQTQRRDISPEVTAL